MQSTDSKCVPAERQSNRDTPGRGGRLGWFPRDEPQSPPLCAWSACVLPPGRTSAAEAGPRRCTAWSAGRTCETAAPIPCKGKGSTVSGLEIQCPARSVGQSAPPTHHGQRHHQHHYHHHRHQEPTCCTVAGPGESGCPARSASQSAPPTHHEHQHHYHHHHQEPTCCTAAGPGESGCPARSLSQSAPPTHHEQHQHHYHHHQEPTCCTAAGPG